MYTQPMSEQGPGQEDIGNDVINWKEPSQEQGREVQEAAPTIDNLADRLGFTETAEMQALAYEEWDAYSDAAEAIVQNSEIKDPSVQVGLLVAVAKRKYTAGRIESALEDLQDAANVANDIQRPDIIDQIYGIMDAIEAAQPKES